MSFYLSLILAFVLLPVQTWCQSVQDDWTAPAAPDGSTPLQSGTKFTLLWKPNLQNSFKTYCPLCDTEKLDLWITNFNGTDYRSKIGRGIDITTSSSYDWNVNIASNVFSEKDFWVFRFTFFDSVDPFTQQISSPGFKISGLVKASSTTAQSSGTTSTASTSSSIAATSTNATTLNSSTPQSTESVTTDPSTPSKSKAWIAGVVVGPVVGIALGAVLMWFCLRRRKSKRAQHNHGTEVPIQNNHHQQYAPDADVKERYSHTVTSDSQPWKHHAESHGQDIVEAPDNSTHQQQPAELWQGNYRS